MCSKENMEAATNSGSWQWRDKADIHKHICRESFKMTITNNEAIPHWIYAWENLIWKRYIQYIRKNRSKVRKTACLLFSCGLPAKDFILPLTPIMFNSLMQELTSTPFIHSFCWKTLEFPACLCISNFLWLDSIQEGSFKTFVPAFWLSILLSGNWQ